MGLIRKKRSRTDIVSDALHAAGTAVAERVGALTPEPKPRKRHTVRRLFGLAVLAGVAYAAVRKLRGPSADAPLHVTSAPESWAPRPVPASPPTPVAPVAEDIAEQDSSR